MSIPHVGSRQPERASWSCEHLKHALALALGSTIDALSAPMLFFVTLIIFQLTPHPTP